MTLSVVSNHLYLGNLLLELVSCVVGMLTTEPRRRRGSGGKEGFTVSVSKAAFGQACKQAF